VNVTNGQPKDIDIESPQDGVWTPIDLRHFPLLFSCLAFGSGPMLLSMKAAHVDAAFLVKNF
jgi:hypothetical protein